MTLTFVYDLDNIKLNQRVKYAARGLLYLKWSIITLYKSSKELGNNRPCYGPILTPTSTRILHCNQLDPFGRLATTNIQDRQIQQVKDGICSGQSVSGTRFSSLFSHKL